MSVATILIIVLACSAPASIVVIAACALSSQTSQELEGWPGHQEEADYEAICYAEEAI